MKTQAKLNDFEKDYWAYVKDSELGAKALKFDIDNPHIYEIFRGYANKARMRGFQRYSSKTIFEIIRWHKTVETTDTEFKLSNNHTAYYAKKLMAFDSKFHDFFQVKC